MARQIKLVFPTLESEVTATLLEKDAPQTCAAVWQALAQPQQTTLSARSAAPEAHIAMPAAMPATAGENNDAQPIPGDILLSSGAGSPAGPSLAATFARRSLHLTPDSDGGGNLFAVVTQNLAVLQQAALSARHNPLPVHVQRAAPCPMPFVRDGIIQVGLVVENLEKSADMWWKLFGIGPWKIYNYGPPLLKFFNYHGLPADSRFRIALAWIGPLCIELIEPGEGVSIYHDFAREHGYGLHHLAVSVEDMREAIAQATAGGLTVTQEGGGQGLDGSGHFAYLSSETHMDAIIELVQFPKLRVKPAKVFPPQSSGG